MCLSVLLVSAAAVLLIPGCPGLILPQEAAPVGQLRKSCFTTDYYLRIQNYMKHSPRCSNFTLQDTVIYTDQLMAWQVPKEIRANMPMYFAGYDYDDRPIWVAEAGKLRLKELYEKNGARVYHDFERYIIQEFFHVLKAMKTEGTDTLEENQYVLIMDLEDLQMSQVMHLPTASFVLKFFSNFVGVFLVALNRVIGINANYPTEVFVKMARPVLGGFFERVEMYGGKKAIWRRVMAQTLPYESLPEWYGGSRSWTPIKTPSECT